MGTTYIIEQRLMRRGCALTRLHMLIYHRSIHISVILAQLPLLQYLSQHETRVYDREEE